MAGAFGAVALFVLSLLLGANTAPGREILTWLVPRLTLGAVGVEGLGGSFPAHLRARRLTLADAAGPWLTARNVVLDWQPLRLLDGQILVDRLTASAAELDRLPAEKKARTGTAAPPSPRHPIPLIVRRLAIARLTIPPAFSPALAGRTVSLAVTASGERAIAGKDALSLDARPLAGGGRYQVRVELTSQTVALAAHIEEPAHGLLAGLAGVTPPGPIRLDVQLSGPRNDIAAHLNATAGPLVARASGRIDLVARAADLAFGVTAPAMAPRPGIAWRSADLTLRFHGAFAKPVVSGNFGIAGLSAAGAKIARLVGSLMGSGGRARLEARLTGVVLPGPAPELLAKAPLVLDATALLDAPGRPISFTLRHPLISARGEVRTAGHPTLAATIDLPDLSPLSAIAGLTLAGSGSAKLAASEQPRGFTLAAKAALALTGGSTPVFSLLGPAPHLALAAHLQKSDLTLSRFSLTGRAVSFDAHGSMAAGKLALAWQAGLPDLERADAALRGALAAKGRIDGPSNALSLAADLNGTLGTAAFAPLPFHARLAATGWPAAPAAELTAQAELQGAPLDLSLAAARGPDGANTVTIKNARWKSGHAAGTIALAKGGAPAGRISFAISRLADFSSFAGFSLQGSLTGSLAAAERQREPELVLDLKGIGIAAAGASVAHAQLTAALIHPLANRRIEATMRLAGLTVDGVSGAATLSASGLANALALRLHGDFPSFGHAALSAAMLVDAGAGSASLSALDATWRSASVRLLAPARILFSPGVSVEGLRLGMAGAELDASGRIRPDLALTLALRNATPALLAPFAPGLSAKGRLDASARLAGTLAAPTGSLSVSARGLGLASGPAAGLPPASLDLTAALAGHSAQIRAELADGAATRVALSGAVPLAARGALDLGVKGQADLALFQPVLAAAGRRIAGRLLLDATLRGTLANPAISGSARLSGGTIADYASGLSLTGIDAEATMAGGSVRIVRFAAHAGPGSIGATGSIGVFEPGVPVSLAVTARDAELPQSDLLTAWLDSDLHITGFAERALAARGTIHIRRAEIRIPKSLPPTVVVLHVVRAGQAPLARPAAAAPNVALDVRLDAPREVFVRGRGVDAEFGGRIHVLGSVAAPRPEGSFRLIRGRLSIAGQALTFTSGTIGFNGGNPADPTLDLVATASTRTTTATLTLSGTVRKPKLSLSSVPEMPQDQVLAALLFGSNASNLSLFQLAEMADALGSLSGVGPSVGNPLGTLRKGLGLDQLSIGAGANGAPTVQAGRYIARGVYVGANQSSSGGGTQAKVKIDLTKRLKLDATVGTGAGGATGANSANSSSVGLTYQFQY